MLVSLDRFRAFVPRCYARELPRRKGFGLRPEPPVSACPNEPRHPSSCWVLEPGWLHSEALSESSWRRRVVAVRLYSSLVAPEVMRTSSTRRTWGSPTKSPSPQNGAAGRSKSKMFCHVLLILVFQYDLAVHTSTFVMGSTCCLSGVGGCGAEGASSIEAVGHCLLARAEREDIRTTPTSREFGRGQTDDG